MGAAKHLFGNDRIEVIRNAERMERSRVAAIIERDRMDRIHEEARNALDRSDWAERDKRKNETWLEYKTRIAQADAYRRARIGGLLTPENEARGGLVDAEVRHIETDTIANTRRRLGESPIDVMYDRGGLSPERYRAAEEIQAIFYAITGDVGMRSAHLKVRVDQSASMAVPDVERLAYVCASLAYTRWRQQLPVPRMMVIEMLTERRALAFTARKFRMGWPRARRILFAALDRWEGILMRVFEEIDEADVAALVRRIDGNEKEVAQQ